MAKLILILICLVPRTQTVNEKVDCIQLSHVYSKTGEYMLDQFIFYEIQGDELHVIDWFLIPKHKARAPLKKGSPEYHAQLRKFHRNWAKKYPEHKPPNVANPEFIYWNLPRKINNKYYLSYYYHSHIYNICSNYYFETWTQFDPESENQRILPKKARKGFKIPLDKRR